MVTGEAPPVREVCRACQYGRGEDRECILLDRGDQQVLLEEGPCRLSERIHREAVALIRRRYPFARRLEEDLAAEALLRILEGGRLLAPGQIRHLPILERRLRESVRNAVIDGLRHHRLVTRIRCGACVDFSTSPPPPGCSLSFLPDLGTESRPNPWYGDRVNRNTDPRGLKPPCDAFRWRRPETHDIFAEEVPGMNPEGTRRERAVSILVQALDRMAQNGAAGMRAASTLFWHYLRGRTVRDLAAEGKVSEKTIKRVLADGRERLLEILQRDFDVRDPGEIL